ncbi:NAD(P)H-hydrate dehydratase [Isoalcanivorax indicus]|uniref:NAD(P)H-hydrate dehydratase n=1 Tax=Isoalcanivorax indicus TaxID=2202653 RepID=UPI000DB93721|nr:NAD(P)H-hydrate dehydratase [Isoalcanivorax indicus]
MLAQLPRTPDPHWSRLDSADGTRALDRYAIEQAGIAGETLMQRAGEAAFALLRQRWPEARRLLICCGGGNNGGDGYVVAALARQAGLSPMLLAMTPRDALKGDARTMADRAAEVPQVNLASLPAALRGADLVVDALLGTGADKPVREPLAAVIDAINASARPVLALDLPSGLHADSGRPLGVAVRASATITFIGVKQGLLTGAGLDHAGALSFNHLGVPLSVYQRVPPAALCPNPSWLPALLPPRLRAGHKGLYGHVLVIGGDHGYAGAAMMAAQAALRCGAGLVSVATRAQHVSAFLTRQPELMVRGVDTRDDLQPLLDKASVLVVGPGLGQDKWGQVMLDAALASGLPAVLDADAINLLAGHSERPQRADLVWTPHPGEAARLLGQSAASVQQDRFAALDALCQHTGGTVLLKGVGTLINHADARQPPVLIRQGNPGMASGGMGDVLSGIIGALLGQGLSPREAAAGGGLLHALAGDQVAARQGERGMAATDLLAELPALINDQTHGQGAA